MKLLSVWLLTFLGPLVFADAQLDEKLSNVGYGNQLKKVKELVEAGANVNALGYSGYTPLANAVMRNQLDIAAYLLSKGADVNAKGRDGLAPLFWTTIHYNNIKMVELLVENGADVNATDKSGNSVLAWAAHRGKSPEILTYLIAHGANIRGKYFQESILNGVLCQGDLNNAKLLITKGLTLKPEDLAAAAQSGNRELLHYLIQDMKMNPNITDSNAMSPLMYAVRRNIDAAKYLLDHGADPDYRNKFGLNTLMIAAAAGNLEGVRFLVETVKMDVNTETPSGDTALSYAVMKNRAEVKDYLLRHGAKGNSPAIARAEKFAAAELKKNSISQIRGTVTENMGVLQLLDKLEKSNMLSDAELKTLIGQMNLRPTPVAGVKIVLRGKNVFRETVSDTQGKYVFAELPNEDYTVGVEKQVKLSDGSEQFIRAEKQIRKSQHDNKLMKMANLELSASLVAVRGRVVDESGKPIAGVKITGIMNINDTAYQQHLGGYEQDRWSAITDKNGEYELKWIRSTSFFHLVGYLTYGKGRIYQQLDMTAEMPGRVPQNTRALSVPLIAEDQLQYARRWLKIMNRMRPKKQPELVEIKNKPMPKIKDNIITAEDIILEKAK